MKTEQELKLYNGKGLYCSRCEYFGAMRYETNKFSAYPRKKNYWCPKCGEFIIPKS